MTKNIYSVLDGEDYSSLRGPDLEQVVDSTGEPGWDVQTQARPATLLGLELLLQEPVVDVGSVVALLLADGAAALRVAQLAAREVAPDCRAPVRLAECVANIDLTRLLKELRE